MLASEQGTAELTKRILESRPTVDYSALPSLATDTLDEDVSAELSLLTRAGFERAIMVDLTDPTIGIPVVRMVIPGMEFRTKHDPLPHGLRSRTRQRLVTQQLTRMILKEQK
jgi:ribosomal protein S12 methylthiotransferase accessory factor